MHFVLALMSGYQFTPFEIGQVKAHVHHGLGAAEIARILVKADGKTHWSDNAVQKQIEKLEEQPKWRGERQEGSMRPRKTTAKQDKQMVSLLLKRRGEQKVTVAVLRKKLRWAKCLSDSALEERLRDAGLAFLRRRRKCLVPKKYVKDRLSYCLNVKRKHQSTLDQWAYSDGTVFYLDRTEADNESTQRAALGTRVWRMADGSDALYYDCIGPSSYAKGQGVAVRIWGLLAAGVLNVYVLEEREVMDRWLYVELIEDYFPQWLKGCSYLVQDFERCLHSEEPKAALEDIGVELVGDYPKCSQDFNAIENAWKILRDRLDETLPQGRETRDAFVRRLKTAVVWVNQNKASELEYLSRNQKERASDCLRMKPKGSRTKW